MKNKSIEEARHSNEKKQVRSVLIKQLSRLDTISEEQKEYIKSNLEYLSTSELEEIYSKIIHANENLYPSYAYEDNCNYRSRRKSPKQKEESLQIWTYYGMRYGHFINKLPLVRKYSK